MAKGQGFFHCKNSPNQIFQQMRYGRDRSRSPEDSRDGRRNGTSAAAQEPGLSLEQLLIKQQQLQKGSDAPSTVTGLPLRQQLYGHIQPLGFRAFQDSLERNLGKTMDEGWFMMEFMQRLKFTENGSVQRLSHRQWSDLFDEYRAGYRARQLLSFYEQYCHEEWFREKYDPEYANVIKAQHEQTYKENHRLFSEDLQQGVFRDLTLDSQTASMPAADPNAMEGETADGTELNASSNNDLQDALLLEMETVATGVTGTSGITNLLLENPVDVCFRTATSRTTLEELRRYPSILVVKVLPQSVGKRDLETALAPYLLTESEDPMTSEKFILYVTLSEPNPHKRFQRVAYLALKDGYRPEEALNQLKTVKLIISSPVNKENQPAQDDSKQSSGAVTPVQTENAPVEMQTDATMTNGATAEGQREFTLHLALNEPQPRTYMTASLANQPARIQHDLSQVMKIVEKFDREIGLTCPLTLPAAPADLELSEQKRLLDQLIVYLRRVHLFCYYSGRERAQSAEEFLRRCPEHHFRRPYVARSSPTAPPLSTDPNDPANQEIWEKSGFCRRVDRMAALVLQGIEYHTLRRLGYQHPQQHLEAYLDAHTQFLAQEKYKCLVDGCTKMFKGEAFVRKHILNKHAHQVAEQERRGEFLNAYIRDSFRLGFEDMLSASESMGGPGGQTGGNASMSGPLRDRLDFGTRRPSEDDDEEDRQRLASTNRRPPTGGNSYNRRPGGGGRGYVDLDALHQQRIAITTSASAADGDDDDLNYG